MYNYGFCFCCNRPSRFTAHGPWLRDEYLCDQCKSLPRERSLMYCLEKFAPEWPTLTIHESSPSGRGASFRIKNESKRYIASQYFPHVSPGQVHDNFRCENLERLTFEDDSIDIHISQDVMEHVFRPDLVFQEVYRTLRSSGRYIFTVPLVNRSEKTFVCAEMRDGNLVYNCEPVYHGNPVDGSGSLVTYNWGYDIVDFIQYHSKLKATLAFVESKDHGILGEFNEVLVCRKI